MILIIRYQDLNQMIFVLLVVAQVVVLLLLLLDHVQCKYSFLKCIMISYTSFNVILLSHMTEL